MKSVLLLVCLSICARPIEGLAAYFDLDIGRTRAVAFRTACLILVRLLILLSGIDLSYLLYLACFQSLPVDVSVWQVHARAPYRFPYSIAGGLPSEKPWQSVTKFLSVKQNFRALRLSEMSSTNDAFSLGGG